ncbi:hypothetical protein LTR27_008250 [Elasticomyces elasticus]|nr:hypothetical protein LTR27_008250 [Elasticomyces elasticus]
MRFTAILRSVAVLYTEHVAKVMKPMEKEQCEKAIQHHSVKFNLENKRGATRALVKSTRFVFAYTLTLPDASIQNNTVLKHFGAVVGGKDTIQEKETPTTGRLCSRTRTGYTSLPTMFILENEVSAANKRTLHTGEILVCK